MEFTRHLDFRLGAPDRRAMPFNINCPLSSLPSFLSCSVDHLYAVGDPVFGRDLWIVIELPSDDRGRRTRLGRQVRYQSSLKILDPFLTSYCTILFHTTYPSSMTVYKIALLVGEEIFIMPISITCLGRRSLSIQLWNSPQTIHTGSCSTRFVIL